MSLNIELYAAGLFGRNLTSNQAQLTALQQSGFTTIFLWALTVEPDGTLLYNNVPIAKDGCFVSTYNYLPELITELTATGSVQNVLFSIGGWGVKAFENMQKLLADPQGKRALRQNFNALAAALPFNGYDLVDESLYDPATTAQLTEFLSGNNNSMIVTYCPYTRQTAWNQALEQTYASNQQENPPLGQSVQWWNLQCFGGGGNNDPLAWEKNLPAGAGIANPQAFILPGFSANQSPAQIQKAFAKFQGTSVNGGFIWSSRLIFPGPYTPQQYAQAIIDGLEGAPGTATDEPVAVTASARA